MCLHAHLCVCVCARLCVWECVHVSYRTGEIRCLGGTTASHELTWDAMILGCEKFSEFYYASASVWVVQMSTQPTDRVMGVKTPLASI